VRYNELIDKVEMRLRFNSTADAERTTIATLSALSEFITPEAARDLGSHLPPEIADRLDHGPPEEASWEDFTEIVAEKEGAGVTAEDAGRRATAVMKIVREAYGAGPEPGGDPDGSAEGDLDEIRAELGEEFEPLFSWEF
jgi:uncharacterized protein (DUF2267 family)